MPSKRQRPDMSFIAAVDFVDMAGLSLSNTIKGISVLTLIMIVCMSRKAIPYKAASELQKWVTAARRAFDCISRFDVMACPSIPHGFYPGKRIRSDAWATGVNDKLTGLTVAR